MSSDMTVDPQSDPGPAAGTAGPGVSKTYLDWAVYERWHARQADPTADVEQALLELGQQREAARAALRAVSVELDEWVRLAKKQNVPIAQISRLCGLTRQALYDVIKSRTRRSGGEPPL